ncbi:MAG: F0F1 ATP synthase subunit delta [Endozoicomonadaceae bacterium]|nr:F0F1 ATP synthase subunit delta [Endozoicomonadaceae bacterium]
MELLTCARPYAKAAFLYAVEHACIEQWEQMLRVMSHTVSDPKIQQLLTSPHFTSEQYIEYLTRILADEINEAAISLLKVLAENNRLCLLPWIALQFLMFKQLHHREVDVTVSSVTPLSESQLSQLTEHLSKRLAKKINMQTAIDPSLIGGIKICAGNWIYDGSLRATLNQLADTITA